MSDHVNVDLLEDAAAESRARFLERGIFAGGALAAGGVLAGGLAQDASPAPSPATDVRILNYFLLMEQLQAAFYREANRRRGLRGELRRYVRAVGKHEQRHVAYWRQRLGNNARKAPTFDFGNATRGQDAVAEAALFIEETTAAGYIGQGANLTKRRISDAAKIVAIEARHAAWLRDMLGRNPAPSAADPAKSPAAVMAAFRRRGFIS